MAPGPVARMFLRSAEEARPLGDDTLQVDKFGELARELECDEDEETFDERLKKLTKAPKPQPAKDDD